MVHVLAPKPADPRLPLFLNVDASVGENAQNSSTEDVMLVQYLLRMLGEHPAGRAHEIVPALLKVVPTGMMDADTIAAIRAMQSLTVEGGRGDGKVSPAKDYSYGNNYYMICHLNAVARNRHKDLYPNLDHLPDCPPALREAIRRALIGEA